MGVINCGECGVSVSFDAKACPGCGAGRKVFRRPAGSRGRMSLMKKIGIGFGALIGLSVIIQAATGGGEAVQAETLQEKQSKQRGYAAYLSARAVKASLRNPDSVDFSEILANEDGSVVCVTYRAQNGFGGMNIERIVFKDGEPSQARSSWRANCANKMLFDVTNVESLI
jgi:hypothetical protein